MKAIIMAGGQGTRLRSISEDLPKPMVPVLGKPILEYQIEELKKSGIDDIVIMTGYKAERIREYFGDGSRLSVHISYINEDYPMGTAGALYFLRDTEDEDLLLLMGDLMLSVDFQRFMEYHRMAGGLVTLFAHPNSHPYDSDVLIEERELKAADFTEDKCGLYAEQETVPEGGRICAVLPKDKERTGYYHNLVNAGIYAFKKELLSMIPKPEAGRKTDLDKDVIRPLMEKGLVQAFRSTEYVKDMGTPERYRAVEQDLRSGLIEARNLRNPQKCIFLDRDGTLNVYKGFIADPMKLELIEGAAEAIRLINASEYLAIVITNQPVIARGELSFRGLDEIHAKLETELGRQGAYLDDLIFCPHHPHSGFEGEIRELKFDCSCRKPKAGMLRMAAQRYNIDLSASYMIGDMTMDVMCGKNAGASSVLLKTGVGGSDKSFDVEPDMVAQDLLEAVRRILKKD